MFSFLLSHKDGLKRKRKWSKSNNNTSYTTVVSYEIFCHFKSNAVSSHTHKPRIPHLSLLMFLYTVFP